MAVEVAGERVLLTRREGRIYAVVNRCPHMGLKMTKGKLREGVIECPWHGSRFDMCTGANLDWVHRLPFMPLPAWSHKLIAMGKKPAPLTTLPVQERDGQVLVGAAI